MTIDQTPPALFSFKFRDDGRDIGNTAPNVVTWVFNEDVSPSVTAADLRVRRVSDNLIVTPTGVTQSGNTYNFAFATPLPDGQFAAEILAGSVADRAGNSNLALTSTPFVYRAGDANGDGAVNFSDLLTLASKYTQTGRRFWEGDFNYDGTVNFADLLILASHYDQPLATVQAVNGSIASTSSLSTSHSRITDEVLT
ncbi:MAG: dockerin type I repeat-containing protein [Tepidisphaeraceae bacterium]